MSKTAIKSLIEEITNSKLKPTPKKLIELLEAACIVERQQIIDAFEEGVKYGNSQFQTFDYPASRYYGFTYQNLENKK